MGSERRLSSGTICIKLRNPASSTKKKLDFARGFAGFLGCPMLNSDPLKPGKMSQKSVLLISFFETGTCI
jgi:hypothetical protein